MPPLTVGTGETALQEVIQEVACPIARLEARLLAHGGGGCAVLASRAWERKWWLLTQHQPEGGEGVEELSEAGRK